MQSPDTLVIMLTGMALLAWVLTAHGGRPELSLQVEAVSCSICCHHQCQSRKQPRPA